MIRRPLATLPVAFSPVALSLAALSLAGTAQAAPPRTHIGTPAGAGTNVGGSRWNGTVTVTPQGTRVLGNPNADLKLVEYVSYTCPHCSHFTIESDGAMQMYFIRSGQLSLEVRHILRDPVDLTMALMANCVPAPRFYAIHAGFMRRQDEWMAIAEKANEAQQKRWTTGDQGQRLRAIANDLKLYDIAASYGLERPTADRCLADTTLAKRLADQTRAAAELGVDSTPSFALNGEVLAGTHSWETLSPQLQARAKP